MKANRRMKFHLLIPLILTLSLLGCQTPPTADAAPTVPPTQTAIPMPEIAPLGSVPAEQLDLDASNEADQALIVDLAAPGDKYVFVDATTLMAPPVGKTVGERQQAFLDDANVQRSVLKQQGYALGYTSVHVREDGLVNTVTTFDKDGKNIYVPTIMVSGEKFYSSSTSKAYFDIEIPDEAKPKYRPVKLPPYAQPESVTVRYQGEAEILEVTDRFGNQWVWDFRKGEFVSMIDRPSSTEMKAALPDYVAAYARTAQSGQEALFSSPEVVMDRFEERTGAGKDGISFKALVDPHTSTILFLKTQNEETGEWGWELVRLKDLAELSNLRLGSENRITSNFFDELNAATIGLSIDWLHQYGWESIDREIEVLTSNGIKPENITLGSALMGGVGTPDWFAQMDHSPEYLENFIVEYVTDMVIYGKKNGISTFIILNEPFFETPSRGVLRPDYFYEKLGDRYYEIAFTAARAAYPEANLILLDDGNHFNLFNPDGTVDLESQASVTYRIAQKLKGVEANGRPVLDTVGFQMHLVDMDWVPGGMPSDDNISATMRAFKDLGYNLVVSEFDYGMHNYLETEQQKEVRQAKEYQRMLKLILEEGITDITFWGIDDKGNHTWYYDLGIYNANPTMFSGGDPKLSYYAVLRVLSEYLLNNK